MAISRAKVWVAAEVLTAADQNAEINNIIDKALARVSPWTGSMAAGGFDLTGLDELAFNDADADASATGRIRRTDQHLEWHDATASWPMQLLIGGGIFGLTISNGTDATNDINVAVGQCIDDTEIETLRLTTALSGKQLDAAWAVGANAGMLDTGAIANTTYHIFIIKRVDTGVTDILASTSATAPTMPTSYTLQRRIGSIIRESAALVAFTQDGDYFRRASILTISVTNPGTSAVTRTMDVPAGINVFVIFGTRITNSGTSELVYFSDLAATDEAPSSTATPLSSIAHANSGEVAVGQYQIRTNTSRGIRSRAATGDANTSLRMATLGWIDRRGQDA